MYLIVHVQVRTLQTLSHIILPVQLLLQRPRNLRLPQHLQHDQRRRDADVQAVDSELESFRTPDTYEVVGLVLDALPEPCALAAEHEDGGVREQRGMVLQDGEGVRARERDERRRVLGVEGVAEVVGGDVEVVWGRERHVGGVDAPAVDGAAGEEGERVVDGQDGHGLGGARGRLDGDAVERRGGTRRHGDGVDAEVVGGADDGAEVARVDDAVEVEDEGVAPAVAVVGDAVVGAVDGFLLAALPVEVEVEPWAGSQGWAE